MRLLLLSALLSSIATFSSAQTAKDKNTYISQVKNHNCVFRNSYKEEPYDKPYEVVKFTSGLIISRNCQRIEDIVEYGKWPTPQYKLKDGIQIIFPTRQPVPNQLSGPIVLPIRERFLPYSFIRLYEHVRLDTNAVGVHLIYNEKLFGTSPEKLNDLTHEQFIFFKTTILYGIPIVSVINRKNEGLPNIFVKPDGGAFTLNASGTPVAVITIGDDGYYDSIANRKYNPIIPVSWIIASERNLQIGADAMAEVREKADAEKERAKAKADSLRTAAVHESMLRIISGL